MGVLEELDKGKKHWNQWISVADSPPNLSKLELGSRDLRGYQFTKCSFYGTHFGTCKLFGADFLDARLQDADLSETTGLTDNALSGADLRGARLPGTVDFANLSALQEAGPKMQRFQWLTLLFGFLFLTSLLEVNSEAYFAPKEILFRFTVPGGWGGSLSVSALIIFATIMIAGYSLMVHFFIRRLWWEWHSLPNWFPDGNSRRQKFVANPWIEIVRIQEPITLSQRHLLGIRGIDLMIGLVLFFPILILFIAWYAILPFHSQLISTVLLAGILILSCSLFLLTQPRHPRVFRFLPWSLLLAISGLCFGYWGRRLTGPGLEWHLSLWTFIGWVMYLIIRSTFRRPPQQGNDNRSMWRKESPFTSSNALALGVPIIIWCCLGWSSHRFLFEKKSQTWPVLQANLSILQLSKKTSEYKADEDFENNQFRVKGVQLSSRDLNGAQFVGSFLFAANFRNAQLNAVNMSNSDARGAEFSRANMKGARFDGANLKHANFSEADLTGADFGKSLVAYANFRGAKLTGANTKETLFENVIVENAILNHLWLKQAVFDSRAYGVQLHGARLTGASFVGCELQHADFREAILTDADFQFAILTQGISFQKAWVKGANFANARIENADFRETNLATAQIAQVLHIKNSRLDGLYFNDLALFNMVFEGSSMSNCNFENSILQGANFSLAKLEGAVFERADLRMANFSSAVVLQTKMRCSDLRQATFVNTHLKGLNLSYSDLRGANFTNATGYSDVNFPCIVEGALLDPQPNSPFAEWALQNGAFQDEARWKAAKAGICP